MYRYLHTRYFLIGLAAGLLLSACGRGSHVPRTTGEAMQTLPVKGGCFRMGKAGAADASPPVEIYIAGFHVQKYEVTVAAFRRFAGQTGYRSLAERKGGSYVFRPGASAGPMSLPGAPWWNYTEGASWRYPGGKGAAAAGDTEPVRHIAYEDACAYCAWLDMRLPSEAEREYLAQTGGETEANIWQGNFPYHNENTDGFASVAPVGSFSPDANGLYDIRGNVWEWCADPYHAGWYTFAAGLPLEQRNAGPPRGYDPRDPYGDTRVIRGGSFLCAAGYCSGYIPFTRMRASTGMTFEHTGFRCVR